MISLQLTGRKENTSKATKEVLCYWWKRSLPACIYMWVCVHGYSLFYRRWIQYPSLHFSYFLKETIFLALWDCLFASPLLVVGSWNMSSERSTTQGQTSTLQKLPKERLSNDRLTEKRYAEDFWEVWRRREKRRKKGNCKQKNKNKRCVWTARK